jgi:hypothetical protein
MNPGDWTLGAYYLDPTPVGFLCWVTLHTKVMIGSAGTQTLGSVINSHVIDVRAPGVLDTLAESSAKCKHTLLG